MNVQASILLLQAGYIVLSSSESIKTKWIGSDGAGFNTEKSFSSISSFTSCALLARKTGMIGLQFLNGNCELTSQQLDTFVDWEPKPTGDQITTYLEIDEQSKRVQ